MKTKASAKNWTKVPVMGLWGNMYCFAFQKKPSLIRGTELSPSLWMEIYL